MTGFLRGHPIPGFRRGTHRPHGPHKPRQPAGVAHRVVVAGIERSRNATETPPRHPSHVIEDGRILAGELPARQLRMVQVWMDIHREELMADWELAVNGDEPFRIAPLQ